MAKKTYILDTNVYLSDPTAFKNFGRNDVVIPLKVLEEIDKHKKRQDSVGFNARLIIKHLDELRAKMALAHYYQIKRKLNLTFLDRSSSRTIESCPFAQLYRWSSGDWEVNQAGADIAFMPTGGKFVAGTGKFTVTLEDCVTYSKDNLTNKTYSSNG